MKQLLLFITAFLVINATWNQTATAQRYEHFSAGFQLGTCHYQGDLDDDGFEIWQAGGSNPIQQQLFKPAFGFQLNYHFNPYMYARLAFNQGWMGAADSLNTDLARRWRNLHFKSAISEFTLQFVLELRANNDYFRYRKSWTPYIFAGVSLFHFNPMADATPEWLSYTYGNRARLFPPNSDGYELQPMGTEGQNFPQALREKYGLNEPYALTQFAIPLGIGVRIRLSRYIDLRIDASLRKTFTDYLDDVSGPHYVNPQELLTYANGNQRAFLFADRSGYANFGEGRPKSFSAETEVAFWGAYRLRNPDGTPAEIRGNPKDKDMYGFINVGITRILK